MNRHAKQVLGLTVFASVCMALGMGFGRAWIVRAQDHQPVAVSAKANDQLPSIVEVAEKLNPTVVFVENTSYVRVRPNRFFSAPDDYFDWFFGPAPRENRQQEGREIEQVSGGSGFFISHDGDILTNAHVVEGVRGSENPKIVVRTVDGKQYPAVVLGKDDALDVAMLKIDVQNAQYVKLGDSDATKVGEWVVAIGNPLGLEHTVTQGIISAKGRRSNMMRANTNYVAGFLQTDAAINRGNSGGPLINLKGEVVGINTAIRADGQNIGFAVPITPIKQVLQELRTGKPLSRGWLGVSTRDLDQDFQDGLGITEGALVDAVTKSSPAEKAGIKRLDIIVSVDGKPIKFSSDLVDTIASRREGDVVKLELFRNGRKQTISVTLGDRRNIDREDDDPFDRPPTSGDSLRRETTDSMNLEKSYGFQVGALSTQNRRKYQIPDDVTGVVITNVLPRTSASSKELIEGMVIQSVGTKEIKTLDEFRAEAQRLNGKTIVLSVRARTGRGADGFSEPRAVAVPAMPANGQPR